MKKQIITIAEYDGWKFGKDGWLRKGRSPLGISEPLPYARNLNELHRVALDVCDELYALNDDGGCILDIYESFKHRPIRKRYTHLIKAVADGIEYLNTKRNA